MEMPEMNPSNKFKFIDDEIAGRRKNFCYRELKEVEPVSGVVVRVDGNEMINFSSNDYLGLSCHPLLQERALEFMHRFGAGSASSRLVCGSITCFSETEKKLAALKKTESALILNSGFQANMTLLPAITDRKSLILSDRLNHNSLIQGALLSRCRVLRFRHNDLGHLTELLDANRHEAFSRIVIVTESVFSMDGDRSDIDALSDIAADYNAILVVDEAHATGVLGPGGMGLCCGKDVDIVMGTFGKGCGSFGAYVACSEKIRDYLVNKCTGLIYSTALPPSVIGEIDAALELVPSMEDERRDLADKAENVRRVLAEYGYDTGMSTTQIIPVITGRSDRTLELSMLLEKNGMLASAIRPPTVPEGASRIRIALSVLHDDYHLDRLLGLLRDNKTV